MMTGFPYDEEFHREPPRRRAWRVSQVSACLVSGLETKPFSGTRALRTPPPSRPREQTWESHLLLRPLPSESPQEGCLPTSCEPFLRSCRDTEVPGEAGVWGLNDGGLSENKTVLWTDTLPFLVWHLLWSLIRQIYYNRKLGAVWWFSNLLLHQRAFPREGNPTCRQRGKCRAGRIAALGAGALCRPLPLGHPPCPPSPATGTQAARPPPREAPWHVCPPTPTPGVAAPPSPPSVFEPQPQAAPTNDRAAWIRSVSKNNSGPRRAAVPKPVAQLSQMSPLF